MQDSAFNVAAMTTTKLTTILFSLSIALSLVVHPGFVYTGFAGKDTPRRPGQRDCSESVRGVLNAIDMTTMGTTGSFFHGNYGEGVKTMSW